MDDQLNFAPCGFLSLTDEGIIMAANNTLLDLVGYKLEELQGNHINAILGVPARAFYQFYFFPIIKVEGKIEEMYLSILGRDGEEIPVLVNAIRHGDKEEPWNDCILIPMRKREEYEAEILQAKKMTEQALLDKEMANAELEKVLYSLNQKQKQLLELFKENQAYQVRIQKELKLAKNIQEKSLSLPIWNNQIRTTSFYKSSAELSGDMFGIYQMDTNRYGIIILDVMGHGISSALISMSLRSLFEELILKGITVEEVMRELDHHLQVLFQQESNVKHYCTVMYVVIDTLKREMEYINAGHPSAVWFNKEGDQHELRSTNPPIGLMEGIRFERETFPYEKGGRLFLYTDGITDILPLSELCSLIRNNQSVPLDNLKDRIVLMLANQEKNQELIDDQCFLLIDFV